MISVFSSYPFVKAGFCNAKESSMLDSPILMEQVHSVEAIVLTKTPPQSPICDALITTESNLRLTVKTADCAPILFLEPQAKIIAAVHAGWKGAFQGILENTVLKMLSLGADLSCLQVAIGPHLTLNSFQVSPEMKALFPKTEHLFFHQQKDGIYFDFTNYLINRLKRIGIFSIQLNALDTYTDITYNSYRRQPKNPARQYSFIMLT